MKKGAISLVSAIVIGAVALTGVGYMTTKSLISRHDKTEASVISDSQSFADSYDARLRDNAKAEAYNESVIEAMKVAAATPGNKDKGENTQPSQPYFEEGRDGIWIYDIQDSDAITQIAEMTGFDIDDLAEYNKLKDSRLIYSCSVLRIPPFSVSVKDLRDAGFRSRALAVEHG